MELSNLNTIQISKLGGSTKMKERKAISLIVLRNYKKPTKIAADLLSKSTFMLGGRVSSHSTTEDIA